MSAPGHPPPPFLRAAVVVSPRWRDGTTMTPFGELLETAGIVVDTTGSVDEALERLGGTARGAQCVVLDATGLGGTERAVGDAIRRLRAERPFVATVVVADAPSVALVAAAFRAGAVDVIELGALDDLTMLRALDGAAAEHEARLVRSTRLGELRQLVDDFLRVLVRTERRNLELEALAAGPDVEPEKEIAPRVLVVDDEAGIVDLLVDVLTRAGLTALPVYTGEEALEELGRAEARREPVDMVLVDHHLPGMDGLETIRELRRRVPGLPCMLMTGFSSKDSALRAADLGVVGYVLKPFDDVRELAERVRDLALRYAHERRERRFLARIKSKHAQFLERYQRLVADLDRLGE